MKSTAVYFHSSHTPHNAHALLRLPIGTLRLFRVSRRCIRIPLLNFWNTYEQLCFRIDEEIRGQVLMAGATTVTNCEEHGHGQTYKAWSTPIQPTVKTPAPKGPETDVTSSEEKTPGLLSQQKIEQSPHPIAPDGGLQAWLQVLGGFIIYFNTW